jgi:hypothetical protein
VQERVQEKERGEREWHRKGKEEKVWWCRSTILHIHECPGIKLDGKERGKDDGKQEQIRGRSNLKRSQVYCIFDGEKDKNKQILESSTEHGTIIPFK